MTSGSIQEHTQTVLNGGGLHVQRAPTEAVRSKHSPIGQFPIKLTVPLLPLKSANQLDCYKLPKIEQKMLRSQAQLSAAIKGVKQIILAKGDNELHPQQEQCDSNVAAKDKDLAARAKDKDLAAHSKDKDQRQNKDLLILLLTNTYTKSKPKQK